MINIKSVRLYAYLWFEYPRINDCMVIEHLQLRLMNAVVRGVIILLLLVLLMWFETP